MRAGGVGGYWIQEMSAPDNQKRTQEGRHQLKVLAAIIKKYAPVEAGASR